MYGYPYRCAYFEHVTSSNLDHTVNIFVVNVCIVHIYMYGYEYMFVHVRICICMYVYVVI